MILRTIPDSIADDVLDHLSDMPAFPYIGDFELEDFSKLDSIFHHPQGFNISYFDDTRLKSHEVKQLLEICQEFQQSLLLDVGSYLRVQTGQGVKELLVTSEKLELVPFQRLSNRLASMLQVAIDQGTGIIFICD